MTISDISELMMRIVFQKDYLKGKLIQMEQKKNLKFSTSEYFLFSKMSISMPTLIFVGYLLLYIFP